MPEETTPIVAADEQPETPELETTPPETPETPPEETPEVAEPATGKDDPLLATLLKDMEHAVGADKPIEKVEDEPAPPVVTPPAKTPEQIAAEQKAADEAKRKEDEAKAKRKQRKKVSVVEDEPAPAPAPEPVVPKVEAPKTTEDTDKDYVAGLPEEAQAEIQEARFAEGKFGEKYKGRSKQLVDFYKRQDKLVAEKGGALADDDEAWAGLLKSKPSLSAADQRRVVREMAKEETTRDVEAKYEPRLAAIDREQRAMKAEPKIREVVDDFGAGVHELVAADPKLGAAAKLISEKGIDAALKSPHKLEARIIVDHNIRGKRLAEEYVRIVNHLAEFNPKNETHGWLNQFVTKQCEHFKTKGKNLVAESGAKFLTRSEFLAQYPNGSKTWANDKHWTLNDEHVLDMLALNVRQETLARLAKAEEDMAEYGLARAGESTVVPKNEPPEEVPVEGVKAGTRAAPGAAGKPKAKPADTGIDVVGTLRMKM